MNKTMTLEEQYKQEIGKNPIEVWYFNSGFAGELRQHYTNKFTDYLKDKLELSYEHAVLCYNDALYCKRRYEAAEDLCGKFIEIFIDGDIPIISEMPEYIKWLSIVNEKH